MSFEAWANDITARVESFVYDQHYAGASRHWVEHSLRVASYAQDADEYIVAMLHDYLEDIPDASVDKLVEVGVPLECIGPIMLLTREENEKGKTILPYQEYIEQVALYGGPVGRKVKCYDLLDHLNPNTGLIPKSKRTRYLRALGKIHDAIYEYDREKK